MNNDSSTTTPLKEEGWLDGWVCKESDLGIPFPINSQQWFL